MAAFPFRLIHLSRHAVVLLIQAYQFLTTPFPSPCRFYPTCSSYAIDAVRRYGAFKGCFVSFRRILRCHPFHAGGYDPVP